MWLNAGGYFTSRSLGLKVKVFIQAKYDDFVEYEQKSKRHLKAGNEK